MDEERIYESMTTFVQCECGRVVRTQGFAWMMLEVPAPCCGAKGHRSIWPDSGVALYLETARKQPPGDDGLRVQALMLAAAGELIMNRAVWHAVATRGTTASVALAFMDQCQGGVRKLKDAYRKVTHQSVSDVLKEAGLADFDTAWAAIVQFRNAVGHGEWRAQLDERHVATFSDKLLPAAAALWNAAVKV